MVLSSNAVPRTIINDNIIEGKLSKEILRRIEDDLDIDEKISILFLITDNYTHGFQQTSDLLQKHKEHDAYILTEFIDGHPSNWKSKLLEALSIIQNRQIIRKLGIPFNDLELLYLPKNRLCSRNLNVVAKCLYFLCEALTEDKTKLLLRYVKSDSTEYETNLEDTDYFELHVLYWVQQKYISINSDGKGRLKNLLKHLKRFDELELIYEDLRKHECHQNVLDIQNEGPLPTSQLQTFSMTGGVQVMPRVQREHVKRLKKGLCIIISQMHFAGQKFETRYGTEADCVKLSETFKGFGFAVKVFENLKRGEMLKKLESVPKDFGADYDCVFICILSHGCKGGIIASDEEQVSIEIIEHKICQEELKDVIKVVIIQACQGETTGQVQDVLATDGPSNGNASNILAYKNFCIFMSTMQGFVSVRHKAEGSWFIQEFCNVLRNGGSTLTFMHATRKTIQSVIEKRGRLNGRNSIAQLPELRSCRLLTDFQLPEYQADKY